MDYEKKHHNRFVEGFFWGAVIGGAATYVLSHKKGRELVKELFQDAVDFLEERVEQASDNEILIEEEMQEDPSEDVPVEVHVKDYEKSVSDKGELPHSSPIQKKRFFKKSQKSK